MDQRTSFRNIINLFFLRKNHLIELLFDEKATIADRDDAAMELANFDDDQTLNALLVLGRNKNEDELILNSCGESLGSIWVNRNFFDKQAYESLSGTSRYGAFYVISSRKSEWISKYNLFNDKFLD